ncbi:MULTISPECIES: LysR family transcriptional regulator [Inquilinus]|uniref:DNA-binding transcriptional LysR family regulator n=1 Tax=Inquilinus ginsengisoli TaxID=363840 RepID=A0ABU1JWB4_9PROT|nr:LysR family transcriptional regulator [Inquilinus ginsengisoli]MDR6292914.1 DNA-binding transcriptional LysR family regulator [Inquilinus ginsengisoli]
MEMHQLRYFLAMCRTLNFTRAAAACNVAQPSLTRAIRKLEVELGAPLFHRERQRTHLTDLGRLMRPHFEMAVAQARAAKARARSYVALERAVLHLGVMCTIGPTRLVGLLRRLHQDQPAIDLRLTEAAPGELSGLLLAGHLDLAILAEPTDCPGRLRTLPLYRERFRVAFPPGHRFAALDRVALAEVDGEPYLSRLNCEFIAVFDDMLAERGVAVRERYESPREDWVQGLVMAGLGISFIPERLLMLSGLPSRPLVDPEVTRRIVIATVAGRPHSPAVSTVIRMARHFDWDAA